MKMKTLLITLFMVSLMTIGVSALVQYTGAPQLPYLVYGFVNWQGQNLAGARLEITNKNTGFSKLISTDGNGYYQLETGNWLTSDAGRAPVVKYIAGVYEGDVISIRATDGCGVGDVCEKTFNAGSTGHEDYAVIDLSLSGILTCPPVSCPDCSCGGGSSSVYYKCTQEEAEEMITCPACDCVDNTPYHNCNSCCTEEECVDVICPTCPPEKVCDDCAVCNECPECYEPKTVFEALKYLLALILGLPFGGIALYYFNVNTHRWKKITDERVKDGTVKREGNKR